MYAFLSSMCRYISASHLHCYKFHAGYSGYSGHSGHSGHSVHSCLSNNWLGFDSRPVHQLWWQKICTSVSESTISMSDVDILSKCLLQENSASIQHVNSAQPRALGQCYARGPRPGPRAGSKDVACSMYIAGMYMHHTQAIRAIRAIQIKMRGINGEKCSIFIFLFKSADFRSTSCYQVWL